jgi:hypothetical protein
MRRSGFVALLFRRCCFPAGDASAQLFRRVRGTDRAEPIDLPWLDVDKAFLVEVNERPGDDVADGTRLPDRPRGLEGCREAASGPSRGYHGSWPSMSK